MKKTVIFVTLLIFFNLVPAYAASISGTIYLSPELLHRASPTDTVYVMAQAQFGPSQPLAIKRCRVMDLPMDFRLSDSDARIPGLNISSYPEIRLIGWVTKSGQAFLKQGDLHGVIDNAKAGGHFKVIINKISR